MHATYVHPEYEGPESLLEAVAANDVEKLGPMIVAAALCEEDFDFVQRICVQLSSHSDEIVRGNAVLAFGHLARLFEALSDEAVDIVRDRLRDPSSYVRGQAHAAADDLSHFLGIEVRAEGELQL
jgi:hypothetical protein